MRVCTNTLIFFSMYDQQIWGTCFGFPEKEIDDLMGGATTLDTKGFCAAMKRMKPDTSTDLTIEAFGVFKSTQSTIRSSQFTRDMAKGSEPLTKSQCAAFCDEGDPEGDGAVDYKAYVRYLMNPKNCVVNAQANTSQKLLNRLEFGKGK